MKRLDSLHPNSSIEQKEKNPELGFGETYKKYGSNIFYFHYHDVNFNQIEKLLISPPKDFKDNFYKNKRIEGMIFKI